MIAFKELQLRSAEQIVIAGVGFGDVVNLIEDIMKHDMQRKFIGFVDDKPELQGKDVFGFPVLGKFDWLRNHEVSVFNSVAKTMSSRAIATKRLSIFARNWAILIHPSVNIKRSSFGTDVAIFENVFLGPNTRIGSHTIIHTDCIIAHDVSIGDNCFIAPGAKLLGGVCVEDNTFVGANAVCMPKTVVGQGTIVGACSLVLGNVPGGVTMCGVPARKVFNNVEVIEK